MLLVGYVLFTVAPVLGAFYLGLLRRDLITEPHFVGFDNVMRLLSDGKFWNALKNTTVFCLGSVPLAIGGGLALALLLNRRVPGIKVFRGLYYVPYVTSWVAVALVWSWLFDRDYGLVNLLLHFVGITGPAWLSDPRWALPAVMVVFAWKWMGFYALILLAGLQNIPGVLLVLALTLGQNWFQRVWVHYD
jgi:multiple sugar transport system permease protein